MRVNQLLIGSEVPTVDALVKIHADSGNLMVCSGLEEITYNEDVYLPTGTLGSINQIYEVQGMQVTGLNLSLMGLDSNAFATIEQEPLRFRKVEICIRVKTVSQTSFTKAFEGLISNATFTPLPSMTISMNVSARLSLLRKAIQSNFTDVEQRRLFPNDRGLQFIASVNSMKLAWGF